MGQDGGGLLPALLAVQAEAPALHKSGFNPAFKSRFATLDTIVQTVTPILSKHGLVWTTKPSFDENSGEPTLRYKLAHAASGEFEAGEMKLLLGKQDAQGQGSAITYARRYALCAVLNLVADDDDDGNQAARPQQKQQEAPPPAPKPTDDKSKRLIAEAQKLFGDIAAIDPSRVPGQKFDGWLRSSWHSHEELGRLNIYLAELWAELQETKP